MNLEARKFAIAGIHRRGAENAEKETQRKINFKIFVLCGPLRSLRLCGKGVPYSTAHV